jgi:uncharacterized OsmC-like protein
MVDDHSSELTNYELHATRISPKRTTVDTGSAEFVVGNDVNPVEYFLGSIGGCLNSTATMVARDMEIEINELEITVEGGVNYDRYAGRGHDERAGLQEITATIEVDADADEATLEEWLDAIEDRCPVTDNVANETTLAVSIA